MRMKALGANFPTVLSGGCSGSLTARAGRWKPSTNQPARLPCRTARREGERARCSREDIGGLLCLSVTGGALDRFTDADIGAAATDVSCHRSINVGIVRMWRGSEQRRCRHDLTRLAIAALDDFQVQAFCTLAPVGVAPTPSIVVMARLPIAPTGRRQERRGLPSICTVQAPHWAMPQPNLVPVMPSTSRSTQSSGVSAGPSKVRFSPLIFRFISKNLRPVTVAYFAAAAFFRWPCDRLSVDGLEDTAQRGA
jgi:hypothetical protein